MSAKVLLSEKVVAGAIIFFRLIIIFLTGLTVAEEAIVEDAEEEEDAIPVEEAGEAVVKDLAVKGDVLIGIVVLVAGEKGEAFVLDAKGDGLDIFS